MREEFPRKKIGDSLSARHVNEMSDVTRRFGRMTPGSYLRGVHTRHYVSLSGLEPFQQFTFLIASDEGDGLYKGRIRWYDTEVSSWKPTVEDMDEESASYDPEEWNIDAGNLGLKLFVNDLVVCYWDQQRGMFVPVNRESIRRFLMEPALSLGGSATVVWVKPDGSNWVEYEDSEGDPITFTVWDRQKKHSKPATTSGADGAVGEARWWPDAEEWEISSMSLPMHFNALAKGAVASGDATYTVDNLEPLYGCYSHVLNAAEEVTVRNRFTDDFDDNAKLTITWNGTQNEFQTADGTCPV